MEIILFVILALIVVGLFYGITIYNGLVTLKHTVNQSWSNIDVLLKQRHDELPKLIETCKQYMAYEQETLDRVIKARTGVFEARESGDIAALGVAESMLRKGLGGLFAVAESYPDLKADASFQQLQQRISQLEESIADRRELYNQAASNNNIRIEQFPDVLIASRFGFQPAQLLEFEDAETDDVDVGALFN